MRHETKNLGDEKMTRHTELHEGISGSGYTIYLVVTVEDKTGRWLHIETFNNKPEAEHWIKWA